MVNSVSSIDDINDVTRQARQGSVAAVIQILNEQLADLGVRVRAILDQGMLQILCEAATGEQLEQSHLVDQIRQTLEFISPHKIRRVKLNARLVREQQVLWLEEIKKDPDNQLLWAQAITLRRPALIRHWLEDFRRRSSIAARTDFSKTLPRSGQPHRQFWRGIVGGMGVSLLLLVGGRMLYDRLTTSQTSKVQANTAAQTSNQVMPSSQAPQTAPSQALPKNANDTFAQAIRLAETATQNGQIAESSADWLKLAAQWQQAADLMTQVPTQDQRHKKAQERANAYRLNSQLALQKAQKLNPGN